MTNRTWDVVVIGAGPAGSSAAASAAEHGARTLILERHALPRYKLCGGGLIGLSLQALPAGFQPPVRNRARQATFTYDLDQQATHDAEQTVIPMVMRDELDAGLVAHARQAGAELAAEVTVDRLAQHEDHVLLTSSAGQFRSRCVVGADGSASLAARAAGARYRQVDLGMEVELEADQARRGHWQDRVLIDFGRVRGGYGWIFPKGDRLTVGVIAAKGMVAEQRRYLADLVAAHDLGDLAVAHEGGHLTRCRAADSPLAAGRILLAGDAAGLLEPWTREGISFALRSGTLAGVAAAQIATGGGLGTEGASSDAAGQRYPVSSDAAGRRYAESVAAGMGMEMAAGFRALAAYERHPRAFYFALRSRPGWDAFVRLARGETTMARAVRHPLVRAGLAGLRAG